MMGFDEVVVRDGGQNPGRGIIVCPDGNKIDIEFVTAAGTANGYGVAEE